VGPDNKNCIFFVFDLSGFCCIFLLIFFFRFSLQQFSQITHQKRDKQFSHHNYHGGLFSKKNKLILLHMWAVSTWLNKFQNAISFEINNRYWTWIKTIINAIMWRQCVFIFLSWSISVRGSKSMRLVSRNIILFV
jgi:hypothetical protein